MAKTANNGRCNKKDRYIALPHYIMDTMAWGRLSVTARAAWLEFVRVHNGANNGRIAMSERRLGERLGASHDTARRAINELLTFGFIVMTKTSTFISKRCAAEYQLTHIPDDRIVPNLPKYRKGCA